VLPAVCWTVPAFHAHPAPNVQPLASVAKSPLVSISVPSGATWDWEPAFSP
jgi:hypothetical protein